MKLWLESADDNYQIDPTANNNLYQHLPIGLGMGHDAIIVPISWFPNYVFNHRLPEFVSGRKWILFDFLEPHSDHPEYDRFWAWTHENPPSLVFRRELSQIEQATHKERLRPLEWPCYLPPEPIQTKEEFDARPISVFYTWGYSSASRPLLMAEMYKAMTTHGIELITSWDELETRQGNFPPRTWVAIHVHHSVRKPIEYVMKWQRQSKITVSLSGNGEKSFRSTEAPVNSIMALPVNQLAWSYPWIGGQNAIEIGLKSFPIDHLQLALSETDLYPIYLQSQENIDRYRSTKYVSEYIVPAIKSVL